jgi:excisionase family DNA binding protein
MRRHVPRSQPRSHLPGALEEPAVPQTPRRLLTAAEVAHLIGCHEETVRRAYLCDQLRCQRFGVRSWRFHLADVEDWLRRGAPTRPSGVHRDPADGPPRRQRTRGGEHERPEDLQAEGLPREPAV